MLAAIGGANLEVAERARCGTSWGQSSDFKLILAFSYLDCSARQTAVGFADFSAAAMLREGSG